MWAGAWPLYLGITAALVDRGALLALATVMICAGCFFGYGAFATTQTD
jgi:hypothetical protein